MFYYNKIISMETQTINIKYLDKNEIVVKFFSESDEIFKDRLDLLKKLELEKTPFKDALKLTKVYTNVKYKNCKYNSQLYNSIKNYLI